jgi:hypothetical protein
MMVENIMFSSLLRRRTVWKDFYWMRRKRKLWLMLDDPGM